MNSLRNNLFETLQRIDSLELDENQNLRNEEILPIFSDTGRSKSKESSTKKLLTTESSLLDNQRHESKVNHKKRDKQNTIESTVQKASNRSETLELTSNENLNQNLKTQEVANTKVRIGSQKQRTEDKANVFYEIKTRFHELNVEKKSLENKCRQLSQRINKLNDCLNESNSVAILKEKAALEQLEQQKKITSDIQTKYEGVLIQHSSDCQLISSLRKKSEELEKKITTYKNLIEKMIGVSNDYLNLFKVERQKRKDLKQKLAEIRCEQLSRDSQHMNLMVSNATEELQQMGKPTDIKEEDKSLSEEVFVKRDNPIKEEEKDVEDWDKRFVKQHLV